MKISEVATDLLEIIENEMGSALNHRAITAAAYFSAANELTEAASIDLFNKAKEAVATAPDGWGGETTEDTPTATIWGTGGRDYLPLLVSLREMRGRVTIGTLKNACEFRLTRGDDTKAATAAFSEIGLPSEALKIVVDNLKTDSRANRAKLIAGVTTLQHTTAKELHHIEEEDIPPAVWLDVIEKRKAKLGRSFKDTPESIAGDWLLLKELEDSIH